MTPQLPKALITGARGQLGLELQATAPARWSVIACGAQELDITDPRAVRAILERERPAVVINTAAFTGVDDAERESDRAQAVNAVGAGNVAQAAARAGARLIHISTDFVFDGTSKRPYTPADPARPLGVYGRTKLEGEQAVQRSAGDGLIIRTAWVYSRHGHNFVLKMLRLMKERDELAVVSDQIGSPTWSRSLSEVLWAAAETPELRGGSVYHWTDGGVASRYDFAVAIQEEALDLGLLPRKAAIRPVPSRDFPTPARRPAYSALDSSAVQSALGVTPTPWRVNLRRMLSELRVA